MSKRLTYDYGGYYFKAKLVKSAGSNHYDLCIVHMYKPTGKRFIKYKYLGTLKKLTGCISNIRRELDDMIKGYHLEKKKWSIGDE